MYKPKREEYSTNASFIRAVEDFLMLQQDAHVIDWRWNQRINEQAAYWGCKPRQWSAITNAWIDNNKGEGYDT